MKTYKLHTASGEEILVECDELHRDHPSGRILVVKGNEMKAYLASTIISYHELTTTPMGEAPREQHHELAPSQARFRTDPSAPMSTPISISPGA